MAAGGVCGFGGVFRICVLGEDPFQNVLDQVVEGESVGGKKDSGGAVDSPRLAQRRARCCSLAKGRKTFPGFWREWVRGC